LWDASSGELRQEIPKPPKIHNGRVVSVGRPRDAVSTGGCSIAPTLRFSPDEKKLAIGGSEFDNLVVWEIDNREQCLIQPGASVFTWLPGGRHLAMVGIDGYYHIFDARNEATVASSTGPPAGLFGSDGTIYAWQEGQNTVCVMDCLALRRLETIVYLPEDRWLVVSPNGHFWGSEGAEKAIVYVVETNAGQETLTLPQFAHRFDWKNDPEVVKRLIGHSSARNVDGS
jgi:WD40 repeat protein